MAPIHWWLGTSWGSVRDMALVCSAEDAGPPVVAGSCLARSPSLEMPFSGQAQRRASGALAVYQLGRATSARGCRWPRAFEPRKPSSAIVRLGAPPAGSERVNDGVSRGRAKWRGREALPGGLATTSSGQTDPGQRPPDERGCQHTGHEHGQPDQSYASEGELFPRAIR